MKKLRFLITAGPTREYLDPVRYVSNASSGRMGYALAAAAARKGHSVTLVSGPVEIDPPKGTDTVLVTSADEMFKAVRGRFAKADIVIGAAAVADYRPAGLQRHKIKKKSRALTLRLVPTPDIIAWAGKHKDKKAVAGFALESKGLLANARKKMKEKELDLVVANTPKAIGSSRSSAWILREGRAAALRGLGKDTLAGRIIDETIAIWEDRQAR